MMPHFRPGLVLLLIVSTLSFSVGVAVAGDAPIRKPKATIALDHLAAGNKMYNVRQFEDAIAEYKAGALVEPAPIFDYNLGQCYRQLGKFRDATWHYERFLKSSPDTPEHNAVVQGFLDDMNRHTDVEPPGGVTTVLPPSPPPPSQVTVSPIASTPVPSSKTLLAAPLVAAPWYQDKLGWSLAGAGIVGVTVGGGFLVSGSNLLDQANRTPDQKDSNDLASKATTRRWIGATTGVVGLGLVAGGVVRFSIHREPTESSRALSFGIAPNGLFATGTF